MTRLRPVPVRAVRLRAALRALSVPLLLIPLASCGLASSAGGGSGGAGGDGGAGGGKAAAGFPYTVTNCGVRTTFRKPPERAVAMNQHATEILLALGLQDRMAGTAYLDDSIRPRYKKAYDEVKVLAKRYPSKEALLGADPDFVYGGYASAFDRTEGRDRASLQESGISSRLNIEGCAKKTVGTAQLRREIREVARVFGVPERAEKLLEQQDRRLAATAERLKGVQKPSVFVYDSGEGSAFTAGGRGIGNEILRRAGGSNVFAGLDKTFADVSWEKVVEHRPEVIVIYDYGGTTVAAKKKRLLRDPALADVPAVAHKRFAVLPLSSAVLGVRVPDAVDALARQLHPEAAGTAGTAGAKNAADGGE